MDQGAEFLIYRSSAGSGKTYNLAREFLKLALSKPGNFRHILAVTFTNKATREMKSRILNELYILSTPENTSPMVTDLMQQTGLNRLQLQERSLHAIRSVLHDYSHFSVTTIDSFFQKVVRGFGREIGLQGGYEVELDTEKVLGEITDLMFLDLGENKKLLDWLFQFTMTKMEDEKGWDIRKEIISLGSEIFSESFSVLEAKFKAIKEDPGLTGRLRDELAAIKFTFEKEMKRQAEEALELISRNGFVIEDFNFGKTGVAGYFTAILNIRKYDYGQRVEAALENAEAWASKSSPKREQIISFARAKMLPVLQSVAGYYEKHKTSYYSASELYKYLYTFGLLTTLAGKLGTYRDENGVILISDLSLFLKEIIGHNDTPFIYEKAGVFYDHFLIDEFQDTSRIQWQNFLPLIKDSIAQGRMNLVVGDVKQSIYRWRGGDWTILDREVESDIGKEYIKTFNLTRNWRSSENIIRFNNTFFNEAVNQLSGYLENDLPQDAGLHQQISFFRHAYSDIVQELPEGKGDPACGHVQIQFLTADAEEADEKKVSFKTSVLKKIPEMFEQAQGNGLAVGDIAIIVRNNREGMEVARYMLEFAGSAQAKNGCHYDVISSESLVLGSSDSVKVIINCLKFINNEADDLARINLCYYFEKLFPDDGNISNHESFSIVKNPNDAPSGWQKIFPEEFLKNLHAYPGMPLNELVSFLITDLALGKNTGEYPFLLGFQDAVNDFLLKKRNDITSFIEWWDDEGSARSISMPDSQDAARIITIHKSKGLEFRMVIVPFCNWRLDPDSRKENMIWADAQKTCAEFDIPMPVKYSKALERSWYSMDYYREMLMSFIDNLNLLYVAFTRAIDSLIVFAPAPGHPEKGIKPVTADKLAYNIFAGFQSEHIPGTGTDLNKDWDKEKLVYDFGSTSPQKETGGLQDVYELETLDSVDWQRRISFRKQAENVFLPDKLKPGRSLNRGVIIHEILSEIIRKEDLDRALEKAVCTGLVGLGEINEIKEFILDLIYRQDLAEWFSGTWDVKTEVPVIPAPGELNRMDRVMFREKEVVVLDYKTGLPRAEDKKQVKDYMDILRQMDYRNVSGYLFYTASGKLEKI